MPNYERTKCKRNFTSREAFSAHTVVEVGPQTDGFEEVYELK